MKIRNLTKNGTALTLAQTQDLCNRLAKAVFSAGFKTGFVIQHVGPNVYDIMFASGRNSSNFLKIAPRPMALVNQEILGKTFKVTSRNGIELNHTWLTWQQKLDFYNLVNKVLDEQGVCASIKSSKKILKDGKKELQVVVIRDVKTGGSKNYRSEFDAFGLRHKTISATEYFEDFFKIQHEAKASPDIYISNLIKKINERTPFKQLKLTSALVKENIPVDIQKLLIAVYGNDFLELHHTDINHSVAEWAVRRNPMLVKHFNNAELQCLAIKEHGTKVTVPYITTLSVPASKLVKEIHKEDNCPTVEFEVVKVFEEKAVAARPAKVLTGAVKSKTEPAKTAAAVVVAVDDELAKLDAELAQVNAQIQAAEQAQQKAALAKEQAAKAKLLAAKQAELAAARAKLNQVTKPANRPGTYRVPAGAVIAQPNKG